MSTAALVLDEAHVDGVPSPQEQRLHHPAAFAVVEGRLLDVHPDEKYRHVHARAREIIAPR